MSYTSRAIEDPRAVKDHDDALANHDRAWNEMHQIGLELGHDSPEYADARRTVVLLRDDITVARQRADRKRRWGRTRRPR